MTMSQCIQIAAAGGNEIQYVKKVGFSSNLRFAVHCGGIPVTL